VYAGKLSFAAILFLFLSFMVQPFHQAFANEVAAAEVEAENTLPEEVEEQLPDPEPEPEPEITEEPEPEPVEQIESETDEGVEESTEETEEESEMEDEVEENTDENSDLQISTSTDEVAEDDDVEETATTTDEQSDNGTSSSTPDVSEDTDTSATSTATSSDETTDTDQTSDDTSTSTEPGDTTGGGNGSGSNDNGSSDSDDLPTDNNDLSDNDDSDSDTDTEPEGALPDDWIDGGAIEYGVNDLVDEVVSEVVSITRQLVTEENYYQFSRQSCAAVGDGTFHCTMKEGVPVDSNSAVYAEQDAEGDMEIYMRTSKGEVKQLTDNQFDDTSPDLDLASMRVVWQRLVDGRYQIISYDLEELEETQLTFSRTNSMEPKVSKEGIVWQAWDGNDWEVLFFDGKFTDQITDNNIQDVTPVVEDGYVLWTVLGGTESEARVYSLETSEVMTISGYEGGTVANPRFVLVYDTKFDNGDIVTQGFDPDTGLAKPISAKPTELPFDIPEPDPVGEIRALIQNKSTNEKKDIVTVSTSTDSGELNLASTTTTSTLDTLVVELDDEADAPTGESEDDFVLDEFDIVITQTASSAPAQMNAPLINVPPATSTQFISTSTQQ
tara:strand:- start:9860 stop:11692 length:1833 start_codon:yes stop_codon:yes gene_type:complete